MITGIILIYPSVLAATENHRHGDSHGGNMADHSQHQNMLINKGKYTVRKQQYNLPDIQLTDTAGKTTSLQAILHNEGAILLNFVFSSCTTICPSMSVIFSGVHSKLASSTPAVQLISISIDPEYDTPPVLKEYAENFNTDENWQFYTGRLADIIDLQKAFHVYRGNKMNHFPATLIRARQASDWVRIEGFASASDLVREYHKAMLAE